MSNLNWVDLVILAIFLISVLAGLMRGLVKEIISLATWIAAIFIAVMFSSKLAMLFTSTQPVQSMVSSTSTSIGSSTAHPVSLLAIGISFLILFIGTMIIGAIINYIISSAMSSIGLGLINRLLGAVFGLARGFLIVVVAIFLVELSSIQQNPWWQQSQFVDNFQPAVKWLSDLVSPSLANLKVKMSETIQRANVTNGMQQKTQAQ